MTGLRAWLGIMLMWAALFIIAFMHGRDRWGLGRHLLGGAAVIASLGLGYWLVGAF